MAASESGQSFRNCIVSSGLSLLNGRNQRHHQGAFRMNRRIGGHGLVSTLAIGIVLTIIAPAQAQDAPRQGASEVLMEEIVVTARKREEGLQDTPIAISAFSAAAIEARGVTRVDQIADFTPNLVFRNETPFNGSSSNAVVYIRGVGQKDHVATSEPGVGIYVDGVYMARSVGAVMDLVDIERIEVLRGPQGTLFGRNTIGGAVSITTAQPGDELSGKGSLAYGTDNRFEAKGLINLPINETMAVKFAGSFIRQDGYVSRPLGGGDLGNKHTLTGRIGLRWTPTDAFEALISVDGTKDKSRGAPIVVRDVKLTSRIFNPGGLPLAPPGFPLSPTGAPLAPLPPGAPVFPAYYGVNPPVDIPVDNFGLTHNYVATLLGGQNCLAFFAPYDPAGATGNPACLSRAYIREAQGENLGTFRANDNTTTDVWGASLTMSYDLGGAEVRSITAYREVSAEFFQDNDHTSLLIAHLYGSMEQRQFSQEFQLLGQALDDRFSYILGAYYFSERALNPEGAAFPSVTVLEGGLIKNRSYAGFAQATYELIDDLKLTVGMRYTKDIKKFTPDAVVLEDRTGGAFPVGLRVLPFITAKTSPRKWTPMANLSYQATENLMAYLTYSEGFKSGGFTLRVFPPEAFIPSFNPETVKVYEAGFKFSGLDQRLRLNGAVFQTDYSDIQVQVFRGVGPLIANGGDARIRGFELEAAASPGAGWFIEGSIGHIDAGYTRVNPLATEININSKFERTPAWTLTAAVSKDFDLADLGTVTPRLDWSYRSKQFDDALNSPEITQDAYSLFNANIQWSSASGKLSVSAAVNNIADKTYGFGSFNPNIGIYTVQPNRGREWLVRTSVSF
jgi:iron complex outermembrane recepter protein